MWGKSHCFRCCFVVETPSPGRKMDPAELSWAGLGWAIATGDVCWVVDSVQASICGYVSGNTATNHLFCSFQLQLLELRELSVNTVVATSSPWQGFKSTSRLRSRIRGEI